MKTAKTALVFLSALGLAGLEGCARESSGESIGSISSRLHRAKDCNDLNAQLQADASAKLNKLIDEQIAAIRKYGWSSYGGYGYDDSYATDPGGKSLGASESSDSAATAPSSPNAGSGSRAGSYSETTTQVKGVDEADIVKTDGKSIFLLHGNALKVINAWPKESLKETASSTIEGQPNEMYVDSDAATGAAKIVVYSEVNGNKIYKAAGLTPKNPYYDVYYGYGGGYARGGMAVDDVAVSTPGSSGSGVPEKAPEPIDAGSPMDDADVAIDGGPAPTEDGGTTEVDAGKVDVPPVDPGKPAEYEPYYPLTKVTVLTLSGGAFTVAQELYFEGGYLDSRKVGSQVRTVLNGGAHGPALDFAWEGAYPKTADEAIAALETLRSKNQKIIDATTSDTWVPYSFTKSGDAVTAIPTACSDYYTPDSATTQYGITQIESFDLNAPTTAPRGTTVVGAASTVYATADTMYVAGQAWIQGPVYAMESGTTSASGGTSSSEGSAPPEVSETKPVAGAVRMQRIRIQDTVTSPIVLTPVSMNRTHLHKFEFASDPGFANYVASGSVPGSIKDQYAMDEQNGFLRIATTDNLAYVDTEGKGIWASNADRTVNHLFVLKQENDGLTTTGDAGPLAPNESIYSTRFIGNRGYVVTYRQVDPLFTFDLSDPAKPTKVGELKIPGFSEFMQPIDDNHILTIGRDGTDTGRQLGLALKIFDVSDLANPKVSQSFSYSAKDYGYSDAEWDPKAFTYFGDKKLLAFPYVSYDNAGTVSSLEVFSVDTAKGFAKLGSIEHTSFYTKNPYGYCGGYFTPQVRRGVFLEDVAYSISYGGIVAKKVTEIANPGVSLALPQPSLYGYPYGYAYDTACYAEADPVATK